jgi:lipopolysaccharide biosynthesis regulator YciM
MRSYRAVALGILLCLPGCAAQDQEAASTTQDTIPAIAQLKQQVAADSMNWQKHVELSAQLRRNHRAEEASVAAQRAYMLAPEPGIEARLEMAKVFAAAEQTASAINLVKEVEKKKREGVPADEVRIAEVYAVIGDPNSVFRWLDRAVTAQSPNLAGLANNPEFASVQSDARWQDILARLPQ